MVALDCVLHVPETYPVSEIPSLQVRNKEMGRGYQINVERGFGLFILPPDGSGLMNALDKQLESLLTEPKAETAVQIIVAVKNQPQMLKPINLHI